MKLKLFLLLVIFADNVCAMEETAGQGGSTKEISAVERARQLVAAKKEAEETAKAKLLKDHAAEVQALTKRLEEQDRIATEAADEILRLKQESEERATYDAQVREAWKKSDLEGDRAPSPNTMFKMLVQQDATIKNGRSAVAELTNKVAELESTQRQARSVKGHGRGRGRGGFRGAQRRRGFGRGRGRGRGRGGKHVDAAAVAAVASTTASNRVPTVVHGESVTVPSGGQHGKPAVVGLDWSEFEENNSVRHDSSTVVAAVASTTASNGVRTVVYGGKTPVVSLDWSEFE